METSMGFVRKAFVSSVAGVLLAAAGGISGAAPGGREVFVMIPRSEIQAYWLRCKMGMDAAANELGVKAVFTGPRGGDVTRQIELMEEHITKRVAGIAIAPEDPRAVEEVIRRAVRRGIPVVTFDSDSPASERHLYIGTANREAGREAGRAVVRALEGKGTVAILHGSVTALNLQKRLEGLREIVDEEKGIEVVALEVNRDDADLAIAQAENILQKHPRLGAFVATSSPGAPAAVAAVRAKGLAGRVKIVGFDLDAENVKSIRRGWIAAVIEQRPVRMGELAVKWLHRISRGERPKERTVDTGVEVVTRENVDEAAARL